MVRVKFCWLLAMLVAGFTTALAGKAVCTLLEVNVFYVMPEKDKDKIKIMLEIKGSGWEDKAGIQVLAGTAANLGNIASWHGQIVKEGERTVLLMNGKRNLLQGNTFHVEAEVKTGTASQRKFITVYCRNTEGAESNRVMKEF